MNKTVITKDDGRYLIYYSFKNKASHEESLSKCKNKDENKEERKCQN